MILLQTGLVLALLAVRGAADCPASTSSRRSFRVNLSGMPATGTNTGLYPHGNPHLSGTGIFTFDTTDNTMDWSIQLDNTTDYAVTQAHLYNLLKDERGDSWSCWGGRWSDHAFLQGTKFDTYIDVQDIWNNPDQWVVMLHTEGGHFAVDQSGDLVVYDAKLHETSVTGVKEKKKRFNNRVPRKLTDRLLREYNPWSGGYGNKEFDAVYPDPKHFDRNNDEPFPDANDNVWIVWSETNQMYVPSEYGASRNLTLQDIANTEYLFFLYDDQGPAWDYGGPEGAGGGMFIFCDDR